MADLAALKAAVDAAEAAKAVLVDEMRVNRVEMNNGDYAAYNASTRVLQLDIQAAVEAATKAFQAELKVIRSDAVDSAINVAVGTVSESNTQGGTN
jgi:3-hydroxy-3-methylglutaryl CoA synthase